MAAFQYYFDVRFVSSMPSNFDSYFSKDILQNKVSIPLAELCKKTYPKPKKYVPIVFEPSLLEFKNKKHNSKKRQKCR